MRVLLSTSELGKGGKEVVDRLKDHFTRKGIEWEYLEFKGNIHHPANFTTRFFAFYKASKRCDVAVCFSFPSYFFAALLGIPCVYYCFEPFFYITRERLRSRAILELEKRLIHRTLPVVNDTSNALRFKEVYGINPITVPYGIDTEFWGAKRLEWMPFDDYPVIFHVGEVQSFKNQEATLYVVKELQRDGTDVHLHFYGKIHDWYKKELDETIADLKIKNVIFCGDVDREDLRRQYTMCNVLIHPIKLQGGVLTPYEAICAGVPVVTSSEFSEWGNIAIYGLGYVNLENVILGYVDVISKLLRREVPNLSNKRAYDWVKENKSWEKFCEQIEWICKGVKKR